MNADSKCDEECQNNHRSVIGVTRHLRAQVEYEISDHTFMGHKIVIKISKTTDDYIISCDRDVTAKLLTMYDDNPGYAHMTFGQFVAKIVLP